MTPMPPNCKTLVLGQGLENMTPQTHVLTGPWCFCKNEQPHWQAFGIPDEPFADPALLERAATQARTLIARLAPELGDTFNTDLKVNLPQSFWDLALAPWLVTAVEVLVDRLYRLETLIRLHGTEVLKVPLNLLANAPPRFADSEAFRWQGVLAPQWNHWLFSRLLERRLPEAWTAEHLIVPAVKAINPIDKKNKPLAASLTLRLKKSALVCARRMIFALPFPRIKGFSAGQSLTLSLALLLNRNTEDHTLSLADSGDANLLPLPLGATFEEVRTLVLDMTPQSLRTARLPDTAPKALLRTRVVSVAALDDDAYRLRLALHRAGGCRLIFIQHGGEYGYVRTSVTFPLLEYNQHAFISWGWKRHGALSGNIIPLPHSQLARLRGLHRETTPQLLLVGTEMTRLPYTLKSMPRTTQMYEYREGKARFLEALPPEIQKQTLYRPYFDVPSSLTDAPWVLSRFPTVKKCAGKLEPHLFGCRLLVLDHPGTTFAQALSAGVPTVLFWNPLHFPMTDAVEPLLQGFRDVGMLFHSPSEAGTQVARIWPRVEEWWQSEAVRTARTRWAAHFALTVQGNELPLWWKTLRRI